MSELFEVISSEILDVKSDLLSAQENFPSTDALDSYIDILKRIESVAEMTEFDALKHFSQHIIDNVLILKKRPESYSPEKLKLFNAWPELIAQSLSSTSSNVDSQTLLDYLVEPEWTKEISVEVLGQIIEGFFPPSSETNSNDPNCSGVNGIHLEENDSDDRTSVSLDTSEDIDLNVYNAFLDDAPSQAAEITANLNHYVKAPNEQHYLSAAQRATHTLKGAAATTEIQGIANLAHYLEDVLDYFVEHTPQKLSKENQQILIDTADCLESMIESLLGMSDAPSNAHNVIQNIAHFLDHLNNDDALSENHSSKNKREQHTENDAVITSEDETVSPQKNIDNERAQHDAGPSIRLPAKKVEDLLRLAGEVNVVSEHIHERVQQLSQNMESLDQQNQLIQSRIFDFENFVDIHGTQLTSPYANTQDIPNNRSDAAQSGFDELEMERYGELHSYTRSFSEAMADSRALSMQIKEDILNLKTLLREQSLINTEVSDEIIAVRMLPISTIVARLHRNVRQVCRDTDKEVNLHIIGEKILVDSEVLNRIVSPLMHIIRNAIDHGVENHEERKQKGKTSKGNITLAFTREGSNIIIRCQDDGQGLDLEKIEKIAKHRGVINHDAKLNEHELKRCILLPGFSSKDNVTHISGRGLGMDVVNQTVNEMKGRLDIHSVTNEGTTITLRLPITVVSMHLVLTRVANALFALPMSSLVKIVPSNSGQIVDVGGEANYQVGNELYAINSLARLLGIELQEAANENHLEPQAAVIVHSENGLCAVFVDDIIDTRESVVKGFGKFLKNVPNLIGGVTMADGEIVPVLDIAKLISAPIASSINEHFAPQIHAASSLTQILIVEDSLSARRSLATMLSDAGFGVTTATDGLEAINAIKEKVPDLILTDLEMPRMNGLELASHIRANETTKAIPMIMLTSRYTDKHRDQASIAGINEYLTKPYIEGEVIDKINLMLAS